MDGHIQTAKVRNVSVMCLYVHSCVCAMYVCVCVRVNYCDGVQNRLVTHHFHIVFHTILLLHCLQNACVGSQRLCLEMIINTKRLCPVEITFSLTSPSSALAK